jgi:curved DNA-binding protein CbpA
VRTLSRVQRRAFDALNALGARLSPDFGLQELRREYRRLAYRLHPDRHHERGDVERERLAHAFGEATNHYRDLLAAVDEPG